MYDAQTSYVADMCSCGGKQTYSRVLIISSTHVIQIRCLKLACGAEGGWICFLGRRSQWRVGSGDGPEMNCRNKLFGLWLAWRVGKSFCIWYGVLGRTVDRGLKSAFGDCDWSVLHGSGVHRGWYWWGARLNTKSSSYPRSSHFQAHYS